MTPPAIHAVVLAAGASRRMGRPKLVLPWGETTVLGQVLDNLGATRVEGTVVVTGCDAALVQAIAAPRGIPAVHNPSWADGLTSSLQAGVRALPAAAGAALVVLADQPMIDARLLEDVIEAFAAAEGSIVVPVHDGRRGHPVLFGRRHWAALLRLAATEPPRTVIAQAARDVLELPTASPAVVADLDTWAEYMAAAPTLRGMSSRGSTSWA